MHHVEKVQPYNQTQELESLLRSSSEAPKTILLAQNSTEDETELKGFECMRTFGEEKLGYAQLHYYETSRA
jgi:hypothetical protein